MPGPIYSDAPSMAQRARETENFPPKNCHIIYNKFYFLKILSFPKNTFLKNVLEQIFGEKKYEQEIAAGLRKGERGRAVSKKALSSSSHGNGGGGRKEQGQRSLLRIFVIRRTCFSPLPKKGGERVWETERTEDSRLVFFQCRRKFQFF